MQALFTSGRIIDLILVLVLVESAALWLVFARTSRRRDVFALLRNNLAGAFLLIAVKFALIDADWRAIAAALAAAFAAHLMDLGYRLSGSRPDESGPRPPPPAPST